MEVFNFAIQFYMVNLFIYAGNLLNGWSIVPSSLFDFSKLWWVRARVKSSFFLQKVARWKVASAMNLIAIYKSLRYLHCWCYSCLLHIPSLLSLPCGSSFSACLMLSYSCTSHWSFWYCLMQNGYLQCLLHLSDSQLLDKQLYILLCRAVGMLHQCIITLHHKSRLMV